MALVVPFWKSFLRKEKFFWWSSCETWSLENAAAPLRCFFAFWMKNTKKTLLLRCQFSLMVLIVFQSTMHSYREALGPRFRSHNIKWPPWKIWSCTIVSVSTLERISKLWLDWIARTVWRVLAKLNFIRVTYFHRRYQRNWRAKRGKEGVAKLAGTNCG